MLSSNSAARRLVEALVARGIDTFFGIPGGPICPIFEAIRVTTGARLVESRHETSAAFAATLYYKSSGRVPAVVVTAGPGATNVVTGVTSAYLERAPMLVIVGDVAWATTGNRLAQDTGLEGINIETMLAPVTRTQVRASHSRSVVAQAMAAVDSACELQGPSLFVLPLDHAMGECPYMEILPGFKPGIKSPETEDVTRALKLLREAIRPLVVVGAGCRESTVSVRRMLDNLDIPFVTTPRAKGIGSENHPNSLRNGGLAASVWAQKYTEHPVDVCLVLGTDLDDSSIGPTRYCSGDGTLIHVDTDSRVFGRNMPTKLGIVADVESFANLIALKASKYPARHSRDAIQLVKGSEPFQSFVSGEDQIHPAEALINLQDGFPTARFITDIGEHMLFAMHYLTADMPDDFHIELNLGSMGSGIAGSIGMAMGNSERPVICIAGDGGMQMCGMESLVAIKEKLPILFVVFNDGRYNMVHHGMRQIFGEAEQYGTVPIDFSIWASSFGLKSKVVKTISDIDYDAIRSVLNAREPYLLDVRIDPSAHMSGGGRIAALQRMSMANTVGTK